MPQLVSQLTVYITVYCKVGKVSLYCWQAHVSTKNSVKYTTLSDKKHGYLLHFSLWLFHLAEPAKCFSCSFWWSRTVHIIAYIILNFSITKENTQKEINFALKQLQIEDHEL